MSAEQGRQLAAEYISAGWRGVDPVAEKRIRLAARQQRARLSDLVDAFHVARSGHLKARSADQYQSIWQRLILPTLGSKPVSDVKRRDIAALMDRVEGDVGSSAADRIHEQLSIFFRWYAERDDDFTSPLIRTTKRHRRGSGARATTDDELRQFWMACQNAGIAGVAGQFCLLTATRRNETTAARWSEISPAGIWTIPSDRYKTKRDHVIPLSAAARDVLAKVEHASPYVFSVTGRAPDNWTLWTTIADTGGPTGSGLSWHSLRKTARTLMSRAGVRAHHAERALGHVQGAVERAYDLYTYLAEKRAAFEALASEIECVLDGRAADNVIPLARGA